MTVALAESEHGYDYRLPAMRGGGISPDKNASQAKELLGDRDTEAFFRSSVFNKDDPLVLDVEAIEEEDGLFSYTFAPWGYGRRDIVLFTAGRDSLQPVDAAGHLRTQRVYDLSQPMQFFHWQRSLGIGLQLEENFPLEDFYIYQQDSRFIRGQDGKNPPRTLPIVHNHITSIDRDAMTPSTHSWRYEHLDKEQNFLEDYFPQYLSEALPHMQELLRERNVGFSVAKEGPFYNLHFPFGRESVLNPANVACVTEILATHATTYDKLTDWWADVGSNEDRAQFMAGTWRMKLLYDDEGKNKNGNLVAKIAPNPYSGAGSIELFERARLTRDTSLPPIWTENSIVPVFGSVVRHARQKIEASYSRLWDKGQVMEMPKRESHTIYKVAS